MLKVKLYLAGLFSAVFCFVQVMAQQSVGFQKRQLFMGSDTFGYRIMLPDDFKVGKKYPFVLFLHGAGERGTDNELQLVHGSKLFLDSVNRKKFPAIIVFPQCPTTSFWSNVQFSRNENGKRVSSFDFLESGEPTSAMRFLLQLVDNLNKEYTIQQNKMYVMGLSMGGMGTFELLRRLPNTFAAGIPICGGANPAIAPAISKHHFWVFHGAKDQVVPSTFSDTMVNALKATGTKKEIRYTLYPDYNHNSWDGAFAEPSLLQWLFSKHKTKK